MTTPGGVHVVSPRLEQIASDAERIGKNIGNLGGAALNWHSAGDIEAQLRKLRRDALLGSHELLEGEWDQVVFYNEVLTKEYKAALRRSLSEQHRRWSFTIPIWTAEAVLIGGLVEQVYAHARDFGFVIIHDRQLYLLSTLGIAAGALLIAKRKLLPSTRPIERSQNQTRLMVLANSMFYYKRKAAAGNPKTPGYALEALVKKADKRRMQVRRALMWLRQEIMEESILEEGIRKRRKRGMGLEKMRDMLAAVLYNPNATPMLVRYLSWSSDWRTALIAALHPNADDERISDIAQILAGRGLSDEQHEHIKRVTRQMGEYSDDEFDTTRLHKFAQAVTQYGPDSTLEGELEAIYNAAIQARRA